MYKVIIYSILLSIFCAAFAQKTADAVYKNGKIYTVNEKQPWGEALAISGDRFVFTGSDKDAEKWIGEETKVVDLNGRFVMPGIYDLHVHPDLMLEPKYTGQIQTPALGPDELKDAVLEFAAANPGDGWIFGGTWDNLGFLEADVQPGYAWLDTFIPDRPVALFDNSRHRMMVNSKAMKLAGVDENTYEPDHGTFERDPATGKLLGIYTDGAQSVFSHVLPQGDWRVFEKCYEEGQRIMNSFGIVGARSVHVNTPRLQAVQSLERKGKLTVRYQMGISWKDDLYFTVDDRAALLTGERFRYHSRHVDPNVVKFHFDGTPFSYTAYNLKPYKGRDTRGKLNETPEEIKDIVAYLDQLGIIAAIHVTGDGATRLALDAIEEARKRNGNSGIRHTIVHSNLIHDDDLPRFKELGAIAEFSNYLLVSKEMAPVRAMLPQFYEDDVIPTFFNAAGVVEAGGVVVLASDWVTTPTPEVYRGIAGFIDREPPFKSMKLEDAIRAVTWNGAFAMGIEENAGSIEAGKYADFVILDRNLFESSPDEIGETQVLKTVFEGKEVYNRN